MALAGCRHTHHYFHHGLLQTGFVSLQVSVTIILDRMRLALVFREENGSAPVAGVLPPAKISRGYCVGSPSAPSVQ